MPVISDLKLMVLDMMETAFQGGDVQVAQQMGVNMTHSVKREGVVIIQNQNVEVYARIVPSLVKMLRLCDALESAGPVNALIEHHPQPPLPAAAFPDEDVDPIDSCCAWLYENHIQWLDMQDLMKSRYLDYVVGRCRTKAEAAKWLGVGNSYLCKLSRPKALN